MLKLRALAWTRQAVLSSPAKLFNTLCVCGVEGGVFVRVTERTCCFQSLKCDNDCWSPHYFVSVWGSLSFLINKIVLTRISRIQGGRRRRCERRMDEKKRERGGLMIGEKGDIFITLEELNWWEFMHWETSRVYRHNETLMIPMGNWLLQQ